MDLAVPFLEKSRFLLQQEYRTKIRAAVEALPEEGLWWRPNEQANSVGNLLGHLAGIRHYGRPGESTGTQHYFTIEDSLALFKKDPLLHEPGTKYEYSTFGFSILGCAVEGASKMPLAAYLQANVFDKAGLTHTAIDDVYQIVPKRVRGYLLLTAADMKQLPPAAQAIARPDTVYNTALHDTSMKLPGGGYLSTPSDYVRFVLALLDHLLEILRRQPRHVVERSLAVERRHVGQGNVDAGNLCTEGFGELHAGAHAFCGER